MTSLKSLSYYQTGGFADKVIFPETIDQAASTMKEIAKDKIPYFILGAGSNSLVMDEHWNGAVVCLSRLNKIRQEGETLHCQAGVINRQLTEYCLDKSLAGLSWMHYLPGQVGGTVRMNARCYGGEISQVVDKVTVVTARGEVVEHTSKSMFRSYKDTIFMDSKDVIVEARMKLSAGDGQKIAEKMTFCESDRKSKRQFDYPTCGCVFKNNYDPNVSVSSGLLLERANVYTLNNAKVEINPKHANFVYNKGPATSREILEVTLAMRELVYQEFGVWLEYEMEILGTVPADLAPRVYEKRPMRFKTDKLAAARAEFQKKLAAQAN
jgi:UDP-N-acetylmuramate dehydrogenase